MRLASTHAALRCWAGALALLAVMALGCSRHASERPIATSADPPVSTSGAEVHFLERPPAIDGVLDPDLRARLPVRRFGEVTGASRRELTYRLAYGADFLYVYVEASGQTIVPRDRAYQNGDGFHLAVVAPRPDGAPSEEFYVLGFSPAAKPDGWQRKFVWYKDKDTSLRFVERTLFEARSNGASVGYEALIPWSEIYPFHPWLADSVGFNMCFVEATGAPEDTTKALHFVVRDDHLQSEQSPRKYTRLRFAPPDLSSSGLQLAAALDANHIWRADKARARVAVASAAARGLRLKVRVWSGEGMPISSVDREVSAAAGLSTHVLELDTVGLLPGGYQVSVSSEDAPPSPRIGLTVLTRWDAAAVRQRLERASASLRPGSVTTLRFLVDQIDASMQTLKTHDVAPELNAAIDEVTVAVAEAERGADVLATRRGVFRRAHLSRVDGTLQPYSVRIPERLDPAKKAPLLVFLHGSGTDDRRQLERLDVPPNFILMAPFARGESNVYTADHAQDDVREAIDDVITNYPVDPKKIVLSGFSMGGYGVYRTFYEDPARFRAVAVFSGHPDLAGQWLGPGHPNFLDSGYLKPFRGVDIFIFHGERDQNCEFSKTTSLVKLLRAAGARVDFHTEPDKGHEAPGPVTRAAYGAWLEAVTR